MSTVAQIFGIGAMISLFTIYQQKSRKGMLIAKLSADLFWVAHYLCLGAFAGMIPNAVGIFRELVFVNRKSQKWASLSVWPLLFILINFSLGITTFHSPFNILPIAASAFVTVSLWIDDPRLTKCISIPVSLAFAIYDIYIGSYIGIINEALSMASIIIFFAKEGEKNEKQCIFKRLSHKKASYNIRGSADKRCSAKNNGRRGSNGDRKRGCVCARDRG